jgi:alpha-mannosidase
LDSVVTSLGQPARVTIEEDGPLLARYRIEYRMAVPAGLDENGGDVWKRLDGGENASCRTKETREMAITSEVTLTRGARSLAIATRFNNPCRDHRLRVMFPTRMKTDTCSAESAFDVVDREIVHGPGSPWGEAVNPTFPMQRFVDVSDGAIGLAVITDGLREYEVTADQDRTIAVTLMRAFEVALTTVSKRWERHPEMGLAQSPGAHEFRYAIYPHAGNWAGAEVFREAERLALPLEPAQAGAHAGDLPKSCGFLAVEPANLILSALKRSEDGAGWLLRVFNPTSRRLNGRIMFRSTVRSAQRVTLEEQLQEKLSTAGKVLRLTVGPKKIVSLRVQLR